MFQRWVRLVLLLSLWLLFFVSWVAFRAEVTPALWLEVMPLTVLASTTLLYMLATSDIAQSAKKQAEEMREQRLAALTPVLVAECIAKEVLVDRWDVVLRNIGPGPALDIGITVLDGLPEQVCGAWKTGQTSSIGSQLGGYNHPELAPQEDTAANPKGISCSLRPGNRFLVVIECRDVYGNTIGALRAFRVLDMGSGRMRFDVTETLSAVKVSHRIRSYP